MQRTPPVGLYLLWCSEEDEAQTGHSSQANIVAYVRNSHVQQSSDCIIVGGSAVRHADGVHRAVTQDRISVPGELFDGGFSGLLLADEKKERAEEH